MRIIINADDFGYSAGINAAVLQAFDEGLITSTTLMPNMPGFEEAVQIAKSQKLIGKIGIHLNLFEGPALSDEMKKCRLFVDEKRNFHEQPLHLLDPLRVDRKIIINELLLQIEKVIKAGIYPTHIDSHAHRHTNFFIGAEVIRLAKHFKIPAIRIAYNLSTKKISNTKASFYNLRLKMHGIKCVNYVGSIPAVAASIQRLTGNIEVISHPVIKNKQLTDVEYPGELKDLLHSLLQYKLISYQDI